MKIILDTNVITKDYSLQGGRILKLSEAAKKLGHEVFLPEVVVDEILHQYRKELQEAYDKYMKSIRSLKKMGCVVKSAIEEEEEESIEEMIVKKGQEYRKRLQDLGLKVLPYPSTKHNAIVHKELFEKKPFANSQKGYRDSLIWETVVEQLAPVKNMQNDTQILFLSSNTHDFAAKDKSLHPDLITDLTDKGFPECAVELVADLDRFFKEKINNELEELTSIADTLRAKHKYKHINLDVEFRSLLYDEYVLGDLLLREYEEDNSLLPQMYENPSVQDVNLNSINSVAVHRLQNDTTIIDCEVTVKADLDVFLFKHDYPLWEDDNRITILDRDWNEHYILAAIQADILSLAMFRVSANFHNVISKEVYSREIIIR